jgi:hypothetical protein
MSSTPNNLTVTVTGTSVNVSNPKLQIPDVGTGATVSVTWSGSNCTINSITFTGSPQPPSSATLPTAQNSWTLTYTAPTTAQNWTYTICATSNAKGSTQQCVDPEIDNTNPWR